MFRPFLHCAVIATFTASCFSNEPTGVGLEKMAATLRGDVRLIAMGDSYSAPYFARVPLSILRTWPIPSITAIGGGAAVNNHFIKCDAECSPSALIQSSDDLGYTIERSTKPTYFALPTRGVREIFTSDLFDDGGNDLLFRFSLSPVLTSTLAGSTHGPFSNLGDEIQFRFLYRCPTDRDLQVDDIFITDNGPVIGHVDLHFGARKYWHKGEYPEKGSSEAIEEQINASSIDFTIVNTSNLRVGIEQTALLRGTDKYFQPAGCIYYRKDSAENRLPGMYYSHISDDSWQFLGFGCDTAGNGTHDKKFSLEQFTHWLDVTTLDREQETVFLWYLAPEALSYSTAHERFTNMIEQANTASELVGLETVQHLIIISHLFSLSGDINQDRTYISNQQSAAYDLATTRSDVAAASIYEATDKMLFSSKDAMPWLLYQGFDNFEYGLNQINLAEFSQGDLLDTSNVHPKNAESAAFFAASLGNIIREHSCKADIIPDGLINVGDLLRVISHLGQEFADEDINEDGIVDLIDILLIIDAWGECWPVQAPFNTN